jgi:hypothetical protein
MKRFWQFAEKVVQERMRRVGYGSERLKEKHDEVRQEQKWRSS